MTNGDVAPTYRARFKVQLSSRTWERYGGMDMPTEEGEPAENNKISTVQNKPNINEHD
jgi:hypothetical protein